jgi:ribulose-phosphate 3-epimerase
VLEDIAADADLILIMSVNPGFGGQKFIENAVKKVAQTKELLLKTNSKALIEVDGGVTSANAKTLIDAGADVLVAGSFVFNASNPEETIASLMV